MIIGPEAGNETKSASVRIKMKMRLCCVVLCASLLKVTEPLSFVRKSFARFLRISNQAGGGPQAREVHWRQLLCSEQTVLKVLKSCPGARSSSQMRLLPGARGLNCSRFSPEQNSAFSHWSLKPSEEREMTGAWFWPGTESR